MDDNQTQQPRCTLTHAEATSQIDQWQFVQDEAERVERIPDGARMTLPLRHVDDIATLAAREAQCCDFLRFDLRVTDSNVVLDVTSTLPEAQQLIDLLCGATS